MLPFLKNKSKNSGVIITERSSRTGPIEESEQNPIDSDPIEVCAIDLLQAIIAKDVKGMASAIRSAFEIMEAGETTEENDFKAQNQKAAIEGYE